MNWSSLSLGMAPQLILMARPEQASGLVTKSFPSSATRQRYFRWRAIIKIARAANETPGRRHKYLMLSTRNSMPCYKSWQLLFQQQYLVTISTNLLWLDSWQKHFPRKNSTSNNFYVQYTRLHCEKSKRKSISCVFTYSLQKRKKFPELWWKFKT